MCIHLDKVLTLYFLHIVIEIRESHIVRVFEYVCTDRVGKLVLTNYVAQYQLSKILVPSHYEEGNIKFN